MKDRECEYLPNPSAPSISEHLALSTHVLKGPGAVHHPQCSHSLFTALLLPHNVAFLSSSLCRTHFLKGHLLCDVPGCSLPHAWLLPPDAHFGALTPRAKSSLLWFSGQWRKSEMEPPGAHYSLLIFSTQEIHIFMVKKKKEIKRGREEEENKTFKY